MLSIMGSLFTGGKKPLICVPITGTTNDEITAQLAEVIASKPDMIEWRADFYKHLSNEEAVIDVIEMIKSQTDIPILFTIRSEDEGGEPISLDEAEKVALLEEICELTSLDAVDYEVENEPEFIARVREAAEDNAVELVLSYHDFSATPSNAELVKIGVKMELLGAHVAKIAVMPNNRDDLYRLLHITAELDELLKLPVITMSMGELGALSRTIGWAYGSCLTFAVGVESSAPGQIPIKSLRTAIEAVQAVTKA